MIYLKVLCAFLCITPFIKALDESNSFRLPNNVIPLHYDIQITSNIHKLDANFSGSVKIVFQVLNNTNEVVIHQQNLIITKNSIIYQLTENGAIAGNVYLKNTSYNALNHFYTIETDSVLLKNEKYSVQLDYTGVLNRQPPGFYIASYLNANNESVPIAMTQFSPNYARQMFPCFDEPHLKAIFELRINHDKSVTAVSNMPGTTTTITTDSVRTQFQATPPMSTYSLSLTASTNLTNISVSEDSNHIVHKVYSIQDSIDQLFLLPQVSQKILPTFGSTLGVNYNLPQLVQIAVEHSNTNTNNNWGVITYRDPSIYLYYNSTDLFYHQKEIVVKHVTLEIAKQFFGHTVSPAWWDSWWFIDGLAVVTANLVLNIEYPEYRSTDDFIVNHKFDTMLRDRNGKLPILEYNIESFSQVSDVMSANTGDKAACIIYMIMHAVREDVFHEGLKQYLALRANSTISTNEFFAALDIFARSYGTLSTSTLLTDVVKTWSTQQNVPTLLVHRDYSSGSVTVTQTVLGSNGSAPEMWAIPYNFIVKKEAQLDAWLTEPHGWFDLRTSTIFLQSNIYRNWSSTDWILFNKKSTGYYRINYDRDNWYLLIMDLLDSDTFNSIHFLNRAQLLDDSFMLAKENSLSYDIPLQLVKLLKYEKEYFVWQTFYNAYLSLERILFETNAYDDLFNYLNSLAGPVYNNFERKSYHDALTEKILINVLCRGNYYNCIQRTGKIVTTFLNNPTALPQYLDEEYFPYGIRFIDDETFVTLFKTAMTSTDVAIRLFILNGLGHTTNLDSVDLLLKATITNNNDSVGSNSITINLSNSERKTILLSIIDNNRAGFKKVLDFLRNEQDAYRRIMSGEILVILESIANRIGTNDSFTRFQVLIDIYKNLQNQVTLNRYLENAKVNIEWINSRYDEITSNLQNINDDSRAISLLASFTLLVLSQAIVCQFFM